MRGRRHSILRALSPKLTDLHIHCQDRRYASGTSEMAGDGRHSLRISMHSDRDVSTP